MIVDDLYVRGPFWGLDKADAPLLIDADAVLSFPIILQRIKSTAGRYLQIIKSCRPVQLYELAEGRSFDVRPALHAPALEEGLDVFALEASDRHERRYQGAACIVSSGWAATSEGLAVNVRVKLPAEAGTSPG